MLNAGGINALITTNYYITALGGRKLRADFKERATLIKIINFNEMKLFASALGQHNMITILRKGKYDVNVKTAITSRSGHGTDEDTEYYSFGQTQLYEGTENYIRLSGVGNNENPLETILNKMTVRAEMLGDICAVNIGMRTGADKLSESYINKYGIDLPKNTGIYILTTEEMNDLKLSPYEKKMFVPWFKNSDISQYYCREENKLWLIDLSVPEHEHIDFSDIPNIYKHIKQFKPVSGEVKCQSKK